MNFQVFSKANPGVVEIIDLSDGRAAGCDWVRLPDGKYSILIKGRVYDLRVDPEGDSHLVSGRAGRHAFHVRNPRRLDFSVREEPGHAGPIRLQAEMPGKVTRVLVREGEAVTCDQGLLVLEAMKMQNEIRAPKAGIVRSISVAPGKTVNSGDFLLCVE